MVIEFPSKLDAAWLESAIAASAESDGAVVLDLRRWTDTHALGEGRLLQWMRDLARRGKPVVLNLSRELPTVEEDPRHPLWPVFRNRLGAMVMVEAAGEVLDPDGNDRRPEVSAVQMAELASKGGEVGFGRERALLRFDRLGAPRSFRAFTDPEDSFAQLEGRIGQLVRALNLKPIGEEQLAQLTSFVHETVDNTREHARDDLEGNPIDGMRFTQIRRLSVTRQQGIERLATAGSHLSAYLERLSSSADLDGEGMADFVEATVADSGVGIPARLLGSLDVYGDPLPAEVELTLRAMRAGTSSKPSAVMGSGLGLDIGLRMAQLLRGLVVLRTGRLELIRDTTLEPVAGQEGWHINELPYLPGTAISLVLPWWRGAQTQLQAAAAR